MKIIVCIKHVPNTTEIKIDPVTNTLKRDGVPSIINPDDKMAIEAALQLKESCGAAVTVISMGPPQAEKALREALAMGADEAFLLTDRAFGGSDTLATSTIIAAAIRKLGADLVLCGRQAIDGDTAQVGPQIAEHLGIPQVTYAAAIDYDAEKEALIVKRQFEDRYQRLQVSCPCLITVLSSMGKPRYMNVWDIVAQDEKEVGKITYDDLLLDKATIGLTGSPTKVKSTATKQFDKTIETVELEPEQAAQTILDALKSRHLI
ncbi:MAG: electron transfer flavoprotein subunit beta/FixA family protein [Oscillospiraceae bacterium]|nr:electron transfer flavoprotein subunit beta/FixA family protein [Oscillospiraceae bacterium]